MFRFTIREIVFLTLIVALALGWWLDHRQMAVPLKEYRVLRESWELENARQKQALDAAETALKEAAEDFRYERVKAESARLGAPVPTPSP